MEKNTKGRSARKNGSVVGTCDAQSKVAKILRPLPDLKWCWDCVKLHEMAHSELCRGERAPAD